MSQTSMSEVLTQEEAANYLKLPLETIEREASSHSIEYEMCKRAGIGQGSFSNIKNNRRRLQAVLARKLANALEAPAVRLFETAGILPKSNLGS